MLVIIVLHIYFLPQVSVIPFIENTFRLVDTEPEMLSSCGPIIDFASVDPIYDIKQQIRPYY